MKPKTVLKLTGKFFAGFIGFIIVYFSAAFILSHIGLSKEITCSPTPVTIYILTNGVHTDVIVPVRNHCFDWSKNLSFLNTKGRDSTAQYVAIGWGDKNFYLNTPTWADLKFCIAIKALFGLSPAAIHVTFYKNLEVSEDCKRILLSIDQYKRLINYIKSAFQIDANGNFINIKTNANYGTDDAFYEAKGHYNIFFSCNTWINNALKSCAQKACVWTIFQEGIFYQYRNN